MTVYFINSDLWIETLIEPGVGTVEATGALKVVTFTLEKSGRFVGGTATTLRDSAHRGAGVELVTSVGGVLAYGDSITQIRVQQTNTDAGNSTMKLAAMVLMKK